MDKRTSSNAPNARWAKARARYVVTIEEFAVAIGAALPAERRSQMAVSLKNGLLVFENSSEAGKEILELSWADLRKNFSGRPPKNF